jgi:hypothetical protein
MPEGDPGQGPPAAPLAPGGGLFHTQGMKATLLALAFAVLGLSPAHAEITGRYVEARTASVFAGPCHASGEVVTRGHDAILAWRVDSGHGDHVDLTGASAVGIVSSDANLGDAAAPRRSLLIVDSRLSRLAAQDLVVELRGRYATTLGNIVEVRRAPVTFDEGRGGIEAQAKGIAAVSIKELPDRACCKMPHLVWYAPLVHLHEARVGFTVKAESQGAGLFTSWMDAGANTAFYGDF